jgi:MFS family permease
MLSSYHFPNYFAKTINKEIGELYANSAIANLALSLVMLFEPIFLHTVLKFTIPQVFLFMAVVYGVYIVCIPLGGKVASLYGYKHAIAMATPFQILYWFILLSSRDNSSLAFAAAIALGLQKSLHWPGFHALMARYADRQQVGREFGVIYALVSVTQIIGPFLGGIISQKLGFTATFVFAAIIYCFSLIPLFTIKEIFLPKVYLYKQTWQLYKAFPKKFLGYLGFGEELLVLTIWPIFIYQVVNNYEKIGVLATIASLVASVLALLMGKITDQYTKRLLVKMGAFFTFLVWGARLIATNVYNIFALDTLSRTSKELVFIPLSTVTYIRAEKSHIVPYVVFFEQSLAIGKLLACILGIILFNVTGGSFMVLFILGALFSLLYMFI